MVVQVFQNFMHKSLELDEMMLLFNSDSYNKFFNVTTIGDGKTHYIKKQLCDPYLIIAVNESFTVLSAVSKLRTLPPDQKCSIFFNFSIAPGSMEVSQWIV